LPDKIKLVRPKMVPGGSPLDQATFTQAGKIIQAQGIVIFPAQCLYGIAANALDPKAIQKVFDLKLRPRDNPILVLVRTLQEIQTLVKRIPPSAQILMDKFWPGNLTLVFEAATHVSPLLTAGTGKIGIRLPTHPVARALVKAAQVPITGTSANISGQPGCSLINELPASMVEKADMILDAGPLKGGQGSSIVDVTTNLVTILREGAIPSRKIHQALAHPPA
jgi:L-threonylcarbamoyladenylate synthase